MSKHSFGCPACRRDDVRERNVAHADLPITAWNADGTPADFNGDIGAEWESADCPKPLVCYDCGNEFGWHELVRLPDMTPAVDL